MDRLEPEAWFRNLPPVTKFIMSATFILTLLYTLELLHPDPIIFSKELIFKKMQIWRLFTNFFFIGGFSYNWIIHFYLWVQFSSKLEKNEVFTNSTPGSYLWFILFQMVCLDFLGLAIHWPMGKPILSNSLLSAVIFYWSRREPWEPVTIYIVTVKSYQLPFALLFLQLITGGPLWDGLMGLISGQIYYYFNDILPHEVGGWSIIPKCPSFLNNLMNQLDPVTTAPQTRSAQQNTQTLEWFPSVNNTDPRRRSQATTTFSGSGRRLGDVD